MVQQRFEGLEEEDRKRFSPHPADPGGCCNETPNENVFFLPITIALPGSEPRQNVS